MLVKIGNKIYSSKKEPILVMLRKQDKENISNMTDDANSYCVFPEDSNIEEVETWMKDLSNMEEGIEEN